MASVSLEKLHATMTGLLIHKVTVMVQQKERACEIVQEAFLRAWEKKLDFETEAVAYKWLYRVSHNLAIDELRARRRNDFTDVGDETVPSSDQAANAVENSRALQAFAQRLTQREAALLYYRVVDELSLEEIADLLSVSRKTLQRDLKKIECKVEKHRAQILRQEAKICLV